MPSPTQLALTYTGPGNVETASMPLEAPMAGWIQITPTQVGICGSDLSIVHGTHARAQPGLVLGHEFAGTVRTTDASRPDLPIGARVAIMPLISCADRGTTPPCAACRRGAEHVCAHLGLYGVDEPGGLAEAVNVRTRSVFAIADSTPPGHDALAEPLAVAVHAVSRSDATTASRTVIFGGGPIGILIAFVLREHGVMNLLIVEPNEARRRFAEGYGFESVGSDDAGIRIAEQSDGDGADVVFDCAGHPSVAQAATEAITIGGTVVVVGVYKEPPAVDLRTVNFEELRLIGTRVYTRDDFVEALRLLANPASPLHGIATVSFPATDAEQAFAGAERGVEALKTFLDPTALRQNTEVSA